MSALQKEDGSAKTRHPKDTLPQQSRHQVFCGRCNDNTNGCPDCSDAFYFGNEPGFAFQHDQNLTPPEEREALSEFGVECVVCLDDGRGNGCPRCGRYRVFDVQPTEPPPHTEPTPE